MTVTQQQGACAELRDKMSTKQPGLGWQPQLAFERPRRSKNATVATVALLADLVEIVGNACFDTMLLYEFVA